MQESHEAYMRRRTREVETITLVRYRDIGMSTYTYFWITEDKNTISPYMDSKEEALQWATDNIPNMHKTIDFE